MNYVNNLAAPVGLFTLFGIVHNRVNEYVVETDRFGGVVQVVHLCCLAPRVLNLLSVQKNPPTKAAVPASSAGQSEGHTGIPTA